MGFHRPINFLPFLVRKCDFRRTSLLSLSPFRLLWPFGTGTWTLAGCVVGVLQAGGGRGPCSDQTHTHTLMYGAFHSRHRYTCSYICTQYTSHMRECKIHTFGMCSCLCVQYISTYICMYVCTCVYTMIDVSTHVHMYECRIHTFACMYCTHVCMHFIMFTYAYVYVHVCIAVHTFTCTNVEIHVWMCSCFHTTGFSTSAIQHSTGS